MASKTVYQTNEAAYYTHNEEAQEFPFSEGEFNVPFGAVEVEPPAREVGFRARWTSKYQRYDRLYSTKGKWAIEAIPVDLQVIDADGRFVETIISSVPEVGANLERIQENRVLIAAPTPEEGFAAFWSSKHPNGTAEFATLGQWLIKSLAPLPEIPPPAPDPALPADDTPAPIDDTNDAAGNDATPETT
ncbi:hypothetical protein [Herbaspirillum robiniae]|uniref:hypothetical protein n=1 Tax=Herbaspirillum robiniae TaxID=2014887 RepID=UPI003D7772AA